MFFSSFPWHSKDHPGPEKHVSGLAQNTSWEVEYLFFGQNIQIISILDPLFIIRDRSIRFLMEMVNSPPELENHFMLSTGETVRFWLDTYSLRNDQQDRFENIVISTSKHYNGKKESAFQFLIISFPELLYCCAWISISLNWDWFYVG